MMDFIKRLIAELSFILSDQFYLRIIYRIRMGKKLDFSNCNTMNEKLQWLKINNHYDQLTNLVDKIKVKDYIIKTIGAQYVVKTLKVWKSPEDIKESDFDSLPQSFVIKSNHGGGSAGVVICKDKSQLNLNQLKHKMRKSFKTDIYKYFREWPYKNIEKKIFAEEYLGSEIIDYKFYCFNGQVDCVLLCLDRQNDSNTKFYFFDQNWNFCRYNKAGKEAPKDFTIKKPDNLDEMFEIASKLSLGHPFVRVDLYNINGNIYFGELTFYPASGLDSNRLPETDLYFGNKIDLSLAKNTAIASKNS